LPTRRSSDLQRSPVSWAARRAGWLGRWVLPTSVNWCTATIWWCSDRKGTIRGTGWSVDFLLSGELAYQRQRQKFHQPADRDPGPCGHIRLGLALFDGRDHGTHTGLGVHHEGGLLGDVIGHHRTEVARMADRHVERGDPLGPQPLCQEGSPALVAA